MSGMNCLRREFLQGIGFGALSLLFSGSARAAQPTDDITLYVGTYTSDKNKGEGIYIYRMNPSTGELRHFNTVKGVINPSFLAVDPRKQYLYAVNEVEEFAGKPSGALSAFSVDQKSGNLRFLNQQPSLGSAPCHLIVDNSGKFVLVANYLGGNVSVLPVQSDGSLGTATDMAQHQGSGPNSEQQGPHAHCVVLDRSNKYAFAADLGIDKIMIYEFDAKSGKLSPNKQPWINTKPGAGPRHFTFHPTGLYAYVINELDSTVTAFAYKKGELAQIQTISTLPKDFSGANSCAEISLTPAGTFLYGSNRGHDSIVSFAVNQGTGKLTYVEHVSTEGKNPRSFTIDPAGKFLLAANQVSDTVVTFRINSRTGRITRTGHVTDIPTPVCLMLVPLRLS